MGEELSRFIIFCSIWNYHCYWLTVLCSAQVDNQKARTGILIFQSVDKHGSVSIQQY